MTLSKSIQARCDIWDEEEKRLGPLHQYLSKWGMRNVQVGSNVGYVAARVRTMDSRRKMEMMLALQQLSAHNSRVLGYQEPGGAFVPDRVGHGTYMLPTKNKHNSDQRAFLLEALL